MESVGHVTVPLRVGGKKMRKRRELDALVAHSLGKSSGKRHIAGNGIASHDQLLSNSTDEQEDYFHWQPPKVRTQSRCRRKRFSCLRTCGPLILVSCIFLSLGFMYWLYFDIRQQISEYRIRIEQVSATSQNVPEALQKWHETSKNLEQNQTALNGKLREIQQVLSNFSTELKQLRDTIEKKNENSQETQLNNLKSNVADLGSKITDAVGRITTLEEQYTTMRGEQKTLGNNVDELQTLFAQIRNSSSSTSIDSAANNITEQNIANIKNQLSAQIGNLAQNITAELQTLIQKNSWLANDLKSHKANIDDLFENSANISSHVKSVENIWVEMKNNLSNLEAVSTQMNKQIDILQNTTSGLKGSISNVREECDRYHGQNEVLSGELNNIKERLEKAEKKEVPSTMSTLSATGVQKDKSSKDPLSQLFNPPTLSSLPKTVDVHDPNQAPGSEKHTSKNEPSATSASGQTPSLQSPANTTAAPTSDPASPKKADSAVGM